LIDSFETALRENTPLASINDPAALVEYLNQIQLRSDMVMEELKRVTTERDAFKQKLEAAEKHAQEAWAEVEKLRQGAADAPAKAGDSAEQVAADGETSRRDSAALDSSTATDGSTTLFAAATAIKGTGHTGANEGSENTSKDNDELPKLRSELRSREEQIEKSALEIQSLQTELVGARASKEELGQSLGKTTQELRDLKESLDRAEDGFRTERAVAESRSRQLHEELEASSTELQALRGKYRAQEILVAETGNLERKVASLSKERAAILVAWKAQKGRLRLLCVFIYYLQSQLKRANAVEERLRRELLGSAVNKDENSTAAAVNAGNTVAREPSPGAKEQSNAPSAGLLTAKFSPMKNKKSKKKKAGSTARPNIPRPAESLDAATPSNEGTGVQRAQDAGRDGDSTATAQAGPSISELQAELQRLREALQARDKKLEGIKRASKNEEDLQEEIDLLRDNLVNVGQDYVTSRESIKELEKEREALRQRQSELEQQVSELEQSRSASSAASESALGALTKDFEELRRTSSALQTDLAAAEKLAASRFKEITALRETLQKAQPELSELRAEVASLRSAHKELSTKASEVARLEAREKELAAEVSTLRGRLTDGDAELQRLRAQLKQQSDGRKQAEKLLEVAKGDADAAESEKRALLELQAASAKEAARLQQEVGEGQAKLRGAERQAAKLEQDVARLREELDLRTAQHASAQSLMASMRDQTAEMGMQMKEARERCESLEEELADAHRLLSERSRESDTMRRLLADVESRAEARVREMRGQLESALEDRDRAEEEAASMGRRRAKEVEDLKNKARTAERELRAAEEEREELVAAQQDWKRKRQDLEAQADVAMAEARELRQAMGELRDALDESEKQARDLEKQRVALRQELEERQSRLAKLQSSQKVQFCSGDIFFSCALTLAWRRITDKPCSGSGIV
jgi:chromosome segregation ATPase